MNAQDYERIHHTPVECTWIDGLDMASETAHIAFDLAGHHFDVKLDVLAPTDDQCGFSAEQIVKSITQVVVEENDETVLLMKLQDGKAVGMAVPVYLEYVHLHTVNRASEIAIQEWAHDTASALATDDAA